MFNSGATAVLAFKAAFCSASAVALTIEATALKTLRDFKVCARGFLDVT
ncbi:hypothetical protein ISU02_03875 [Fusibacter sp. Q10-2]|uniref:Uncharacterized protein n=1 Tax=Fusibacter ferrireducens TaxID=2785058 RepID=A0ABR9ZQH6_9FIRM|nr:hypothetical protein [Fusibacter ferrireducens]